MFEREGWKSGDGVREEASAYPAVRAPSSMLLLTVPTSSWQVQIAEVCFLSPLNLNEPCLLAHLTATRIDLIFATLYCLIETAILSLELMV